MQHFPPNYTFNQCQYYPFQSFPVYTSNTQWPLLEKNSPIRHKFTKAEDMLLKQLVSQYGESNWMAISSQMRTRTPRQCRERYRNYLSDRIKNGPWSPQEDILLAQKVKEFGQKWAKIALFFGSRSDVNVKNRWASLLNRHNREVQAEKIKAKKIEEEKNKKEEEKKEEIIQQSFIKINESFFQIPLENNLFPQDTYKIQKDEGLDDFIKEQENESKQTTEWAAITTGNNNGDFNFDFY